MNKFKKMLNSIQHMMKGKPTPPRESRTAAQEAEAQAVRRLSDIVDETLVTGAPVAYYSTSNDVYSQFWNNTANYAYYTGSGWMTFSGKKQHKKTKVVTNTLKGL